MRRYSARTALLAALATLAGPALAHTTSTMATPTMTTSPRVHHQRPLPVRHIARKETGRASIYATSLAGHKMTSGERLDIHSNEAASKTLPIGTKANVTDLATGKTAQVTISDRGPVPKGRVVDLTPHTANAIGLTKKQGIAPVVVVPVSVPALGTKVGDVTVKQATIIAPK